MMPRRWSIALAALVFLAGCKRQHYAVDSAPDLPYPTCDGPTTTLASGDLRSGPLDAREPIVERFRIERRGCLTVATVRQEWALQIADFEAVFGDDGKPIRVWRRWTSPISKRDDGNADTKRYELRTPEITIKHRSDAGTVDWEILRGPAPRAVIGPGRGMLTVWIQRAKLAVGEKQREVALDVRGVETLSEVTLERQPDRFEQALGRKVRVYTIYGREAVFTDENDVVIGDLAGLVPFADATGPMPKPMPTFQRPDPSGTP